MSILQARFPLRTNMRGDTRHAEFEPAYFAARRALSIVIPRSHISHMILAVAERR